MNKEFSYEKSKKTLPKNDFFNIQQIFFISSKQLTQFFFKINVSPHFVILISLIFGLTASVLIIQQSIIMRIAGAILLFYKNVLDKADGSLARAKELDSRRGRFYDSISDFLVTLACFTAITIHLYNQYYSYKVIIIGFAAMICSMLQCSFFIFYQVSFIKSTGKKTINRILETVTEEDKKSQDKFTLLLQKIFQIIYGWQDRIFYNLDRFLLNKLSNKIIRANNSVNEYKNETELKLEIIRRWYQNKPFLTMASSLSIGTHIVLICISAIIGRYDYYMFMNLLLMNLLLILYIIYHYYSVLKKF